jgi:glutamyl-tRNA reductase
VAVGGGVCRRAFDPSRDELFERDSAAAMSAIFCLSLSHKDAPVEQREKFALTEPKLAETLADLRGGSAVQEALIISTCNRVEFYGSAPDAGEGLAVLQACVGDTAVFRARSGEAAVRHLFRVVCGLESMVLGETEVLGQVKRAYELATTHGATARCLHKLFQRAFQVAKEVRTRTNITRGAVSVGSVAVDLAGRIFGGLEHCKVMILGAGETSEQTARALFSRGAKSIFVTNRSYDRAATLAAETGGEAVHFDAWERELQHVDILISSTAARHHLVRRDQLERPMRLRRDRPLFVIDLAVPRDIDPAVNTLDGVYLYDIDSLQAIAQQSMALRHQEIQFCEAIIETHVTAFMKWWESAANRTTNSVPGSPRLAVS